MLTRRLAKKVTPPCNGGGDRVVCRRSARTKHVPKRYCDDTAWGVTPANVGAFGAKYETVQSQRVQAGEQLDHNRDMVVGKGSNHKFDNRSDSNRGGRPASSVEHQTMMPLRSNSIMPELYKQSSPADGRLSPGETNQTDYTCSKEMIMAAVEVGNKIQDIPPHCEVAEKNSSCKVTSERHRGKYKHRKCGKCKQTFSTSDALVVHRKSCHRRARGPNPRKYDCEQCHYVARTEKLLLIHMNDKHGIPLDLQDKFPVHTCQVDGCDYKSLYKQYMWRHHEAQHTGRRFVCKNCGKALRSKVALTLHDRIHLGVKPHVCQICGQAFRQSSVLKCHQRSIHEAYPRHLLCHECPYTTNKKTSLDLHCYHRHGVALPSNISIYHCDMCKFETVSKTTLQCHTRRHLGQRPFECTVCHKTFVSSEDLRGHAVWHLPVSERRYRCAYKETEGCEYVAATKSKLTCHVRLQHTHKDDRPFTCHLCPYKTGVKGNLTKHLRSVHHIEVMTYQVWVKPFHQKSTAPAVGVKSSIGVSSDITGISVTSDILTTAISSSPEFTEVGPTTLVSDAVLGQAGDV